MFVHALDTHFLSSLGVYAITLRVRMLEIQIGRKAMGLAPGVSQVEEARPRAVGSSALHHAESWGGHSPGGRGEVTASSKKGETEPVIRCVADGQGKGVAGWKSDIPRWIGPNPGWVSNVL